MTTDFQKQADVARIERLSFRVSGQEYSVDIMSVREIRGWTRATSLPHSPDYVRGVINLRGTVLPVIDLATTPRSGGSGRASRRCSPRAERSSSDIRSAFPSSQTPRCETAA